MQRQRAGAAVVAAIPLVNAALWLAFPPADDGLAGFARQALGEFLASTAVLLFSVALVLATRARVLESWFGGLDRMYRVHRRAGLVGFFLLVAHVAVVPWRAYSPGGTPSGLIAFAGFLVLVLLAVGPRLPVVRRAVTLRYQSWRRSHRLIGLFFAVSLAHMLLADARVHAAPVPFALLLVAYSVGVVAYLYTVLLAQLARPTYRYLVETIRRLTPTTVEVSLRPRKQRRLEFRSGQFVFVKFHRPGLREWHPFTVSSAPTEHLLRLTIKATGDYTRRVYRDVEAGCRATVEGSYGMLDYRQGGRRQVWIAGGIGVTPFLSWLRDTPAADRSIDLFYTVRHTDEVLFWDEIQAAADRHPRLRAHLNVSSVSGSLTVQQVVARVGDLTGADIYMCGPVPMLNSFQRRFRHLGMPASAIHFEDFSFR